jgi:hypothetical protein
MHYMTSGHNEPEPKITCEWRPGNTDCAPHVVLSIGSLTIFPKGNDLARILAVIDDFLIDATTKPETATVDDRPF